MITPNKYFGLPDNLSDHRISGIKEFSFMHHDILFILLNNTEWELIRIPFHAYVNLKDLKYKITKILDQKKWIKGVFCTYNSLEDIDLWIELKKDNRKIKYSYAVIKNNSFHILKSEKEIPKSTFSDELYLFKEILYYGTILEDYNEADKLVDKFKKKFSKSKLINIVNKLR